MEDSGHIVVRGTSRTGYQDHLESNEVHVFREVVESVQRLMGRYYIHGIKGRLR